MDDIKRFIRLIFVVASFAGLFAITEIAIGLLTRDRIINGFKSGICAYSDIFTIDLILIFAFWSVLCLALLLVFRRRILFRTKAAISLAIPFTLILFIVIIIPVLWAIPEPFTASFKSGLVASSVLVLTFGSGGAVLLITRKTLLANPGLPRFAIIPAAVFLIAAIPGYILCLTPQTDAHVSDNDTPNIIIISIDALRRDHVSVYNDKYVKTPNIDSVAERGYLFTNASTNNPWTLPTFMTMHTGQYPSVHGIDFRTTPADLPSLPEILKGYGYRTEAYVGNSVLLGEYGFSKGYDKYLLYGDIEWLHPFKNTSVARFIYKLTQIRLTIGIRDRSTDWCTEITRKRIKKLQNSDEPYFLWLHYLDPHTPLTPPPEYIDVDDDEKDKILSKMDEYSNKHDILIKENEKILKELYAAEVRYVDDSLGNLLSAFDEYGVWDDSIVIITSDHGEEIFDHQIYGHGHTLYGELTAIPLIICVPGKNAALIDTPVSIIDIPTTILTLLGSDYADQTDGNDLFTVIEEGPTDKYVYADRTRYDHDAVSVRDDEYVYMYYGSDPYDENDVTERYELYSYKDDPYCMNEIGDKEPERAAEYFELIDRFRIKLAEKKASLGEGGEFDIEEEHMEKLKDLGYF